MWLGQACQFDSGSWIIVDENWIWIGVIAVSVSILPFSITVATGYLRGQLQSRQKSACSTSLHCSSCYGCGAQLSSSTPLESPTTPNLQVAFPVGYTLDIRSWVYCRWVCVCTWWMLGARCFAVCMTHVSSGSLYPSGHLLTSTTFFGTIYCGATPSQVLQVESCVTLML